MEDLFSTQYGSPLVVVQMAGVVDKVGGWIYYIS